MSQTHPHSSLLGDIDMAAAPDHQWIKVFMEVVLRTLRRVHYEYQGYNFGPTIDQDYYKLERTNCGRGIELADEISVVNAIVQEHMQTKLAYGYIRGIKDADQRYYLIEQEVPYVSDPSQKVDIMLKRVKPSDLSGRPIKTPSVIEAKRAHLWCYEDAEDEPNIYQTQKDGILKDIGRLRREIDATKSREDCWDQRFGHILVWGTHNVENWKKEVLPSEFLQMLDTQELEKPNIKWLPLKWNTTSDRMPEVTRWLWVLLAEVKQQL